MNRLATLFLSFRALVVATLAGTPLAHGQELPSADDAAWAAAIEAGTAAAFQQYLEEFPAGRHAEQAFRRLIEAMDDDAAWAAAIEAGTAAAFQQYLEEFPAGRHAEQAFRRLIEAMDVAPGAGQGLDLY